MSTSSDSDEFYDAEDSTVPNKLIRKTKSQRSQLDSNTNDDYENPVETKLVEKTSVDTTPANVTPEVSKPIIHKNGRRKFHELRQCMQADEDENGPTNNSTPESQGSSVEGVFPAPRTTHPFRIIEHDTVSMQSMTSLGRIGRILSGSADPSATSVGRDPSLLPASSSSIVSLCSKDSKDSESLNSNTKTIECISNTARNQPYKISNTSLPRINNMSNPEITQMCENSIAQSSNTGFAFDLTTENRQLQEPDVIASTKANKNKEDSVPGPVAPPRRKKKHRTASLSADDNDYDKINSDKVNSLSVEASSLHDFITQGSSPLPSPASTIESLTRELEHSLDITNSNKKLESNQNNDKTSRSINTSSSSNGNINSLNGVNHTNNFHNGTTSNSIIFDKFRNAGGLSRSNTTMRSLDLWMATKGKYVVRPQDEDKSRAEGPSPEELERIERLKHEVLHCVRAPNMNGQSGHSSLGPSLKYYSPHNSKERRKSAGDEDLLKQLNMFVRTRTDSGKELTDMEILEQVTVLNLDTGERVPLSVAEDKLPQCINPLSLHIMRLTSEYVSTNSLNKQGESDEESVGGPVPGLGLGEGETESEEASKLRRGTARLKRFLGSTVKKTMDKAKSIAHSRHRDDVTDIDELSSPGEPSLKFKNSASHKGPYEFDSIQRVQELSGQHVGPVWCMKFSTCGRLLATAGQDRLLRVWVLRDAYTFFQDMRTKYNADQKVSPTPSQESLVSQHSAEELGNMDGTGPFMPKPFCTYSGHTSDLLDVSWSKNYFVLSSSMDKTVRLWHISRKECLCCFQHIDFVTAIVFHPRDDRYFLSGSLDGKLRLWNIPDKKVAVWNEVDGQTKLITAANFCQNGQFAVVGSYDGRCIFYTTDQLKYHTQIHVRSTRGKNATGRKISGIEPMPGEDNMHKILVTSNDSRIRLYDLHELNLSCKYKGYMNVSSQIKASFSHDGKYIVSGSENQCIYIWKTHHDYSKFSSVRRDRNDFWEGIKAHNAVVTCAVFAPHPDSIIKLVEEREGPSASTGSQTYLTEAANKVEDPVVEQRTRGCGGHVLVSADFNGCIKVFINKTKPKHSSLPASALA